MDVDDRDRQGSSADRAGDNVVRFPRDWIGPLEELVPFGPAADRAERLSAGAVTSAPALSADAFWGEQRNRFTRFCEPRAR